MLNYTRTRIKHWDRVFAQDNSRRRSSSYYHRLLRQTYDFHIPSGARVLELGCGAGNLLASVSPSLGIGIDFSGEAIRKAKEAHPGLHFVQADAHALPFNTAFDYIIVSDLINDLWDAQTLFQRLSACTHSRTRIILNFHSRVWQLPLAWVESLGLKTRTLGQNWFTIDDLKNLFRLTDYELITHSREILLPLNIPLVSWLLNRVLILFWPFWVFALTNVQVVRPLKAKQPLRPANPSVSVVIAARNEEGNIPALFERVPKMGSATELIFVEGHSRDDTYATIQREMERFPEVTASLYKQQEIGKADAVWEGFSHAKNDILMILDADISVAPEDLTRFYEAIVRNKGEFINGSRLVYPMENRAMQFLNLLGNRAFGLIFSWTLGQPVKDTLCGTKVLYRQDFEKLKRDYPLFRKIDPFGDFDLLFGASKLDLKIIDVPIRYLERTYGSTNISRWRHGVMLARITMAAFGYFKIRLGVKPEPTEEAS